MKQDRNSSTAWNTRLGYTVYWSLSMRTTSCVKVKVMQFYRSATTSGQWWWANLSRQFWCDVTAETVHCLSSSTHSSEGHSQSSVLPQTSGCWVAGIVHNTITDRWQCSKVLLEKLIVSQLFKNMSPLLWYLMAF
jgi:hypothetical protein